MKQFSKKIATIFLFSMMTYSVDVYAWGAKPPVIAPPAQSTPVNPAPPPVLTAGKFIDQISTLAANSSCAKYSWKNRGRAPAGYIKGVSLSFARSLCRLKTSEPNPTALANLMSRADTRNDTKDALTHYESAFANLGMDISYAGADTLRTLYTLGIGLGMRESSGSYCVGWDTSAGSNRPSSAGEAGAFQTSYDSMGNSPELRKLYNEYLAKTGKCLLSTFKLGASCNNNGALGTGAGADYQRFNIACPAFATEYAMTMLRIARSHYGPINRREAEVQPICNKLLLDVQTLVESNQQAACDEIL